MSATATVQVHDRQTTALILFTRLGPRYQWQPWLNRWASNGGSTEGLRGSGDGPLQLHPFITEGRRPFYLLSDIDQFVEEALKADSGLGPIKTIKPAMVELDCRWLDSRIPWKARKIRSRTTSTTKGPSWVSE